MNIQTEYPDKLDKSLISWSESYDLKTLNTLEDDYVRKEFDQNKE